MTREQNLVAKYYIWDPFELVKYRADGETQELPQIGGWEI